MATSLIVHTSGDIFAAPATTILVHACNTLGSWGSGIALAFKVKYPSAFKVYQSHCKEHRPTELIGTCLLIPALDGQGHDIACLFTSKMYGKKKDKPEDILKATRLAITDLVEQNEKAKKPLHACRFNSGKFGVPWEHTEAILRDLGVPMVVYSDKI